MRSFLCFVGVALLVGCSSKADEVPVKPKGGESPFASKRGESPAKPKAEEIAVAAMGKVDAANEGKLVYVTGSITPESLDDEDTGVSFAALRVKRDVEMYQWTEQVTKRSVKKAGGKKVTKKNYRLSLAWDAEQVDPSKWKIEEMRTKRTNPKMPFRSKSFDMKKVWLGGYLLPDLMRWSLTQKMLDVSAISAPKGATAHAGWLYLNGAKPNEPKLGDVRVRYHKVMPEELSLIGRQVGKELRLFDAATGARVGALAQTKTSPDALKTELPATSR